MIKTLNTFTWDGPGGIENLRFLVVQSGTKIDVIDTSIVPFSNGVIYSDIPTVSLEETNYSFTRVDGDLIVATGQPEIVRYAYDGVGITKSTGRIKTRDLFGVEDIFEGQDLTGGQGLTFRPPTVTDNHVYNLRNQTWGIPRFAANVSVFTDTITRFQQYTASVTAIKTAYPSNADSVLFALSPFAQSTSNPTRDLFWAQDIATNPPGSFRAPQGYFIIDALDRGASRLEEYARLMDENLTLSFRSIVLPTDRTAKGSSTVAEYAGRVFYAGFSSTLVGGDNKSPRLGSYVFYSQLVRSRDDIFRCHQEGDPTSKDSTDLIDTDGGFIRISGAYNITALANVGAGLMVFAENGVWMVTGGSDFGFTANNNLVTKVTERGSRYPNSVVVVDNTVMYWAEDGIYHVKPNAYGDWESASLTDLTIQTYYERIDEEYKSAAKGSYDSFDKKVRWVYQNILEDTGDSLELVLDLSLGAFYPNVIQTLTGVWPRVCSVVTIPPSSLVFIEENVTYLGVQVTDSGLDVVYRRRVEQEGVKETAYVVAFGKNLNGTYQYGFCSYSDPEFSDWRDVDPLFVGKDAYAYLVTGYSGGGDFQRDKQVPYITFHMTRTENGFEEIDGDLFPTNQSSCIMQAQWNWNNSAANGKWGTPRQVYRYKRLYSPSGVTDTFDNGESVISTKNKLRGGGKVLSLFIQTEPKRDLKLLGWSHTMEVNQSV
jgi:hypothetical protein